VRLTKLVHRIALVGIGKIARDQHVPALRNDPRFALVATADPNGGLDEIPAYLTMDALLREGPPIDAVSICTPPIGRLALVEQAIEAGLAIMIEKPPATTVTEVEAMRAAAARRGTTLFSAWHSREAGAIAPARAWLATRRIRSFAIDWREDIRRWHPGHDWILDANGFGVFDPGINALSIITAILDGPLVISDARFDVPSNRQAPIAATAVMSCNGVTGSAALDFLESDDQRWNVGFVTDDAILSITDGGRGLITPDASCAFPDQEYARLYNRFYGLIDAGQSDVDARPSAAVSDAFRKAIRREVAAFDW
jgi:D-galactose 1-dehydrogenase